MKLIAVLALVAVTGVAAAEDKAPAAKGDKAPATSAQAKDAAKDAVKVNNTKCVVTGEDMMGEGSKVTYKGKEYNLCCSGCKDDFNKDPEKYVKALEADPAKYGVKKDK